MTSTPLSNLIEGKVPKAQSTFVNANALYFPLVHHKKYIVVVSRNKKKRLSWSTSEKNLRTGHPIV